MKHFNIILFIAFNFGEVACRSNCSFKKKLDCNPILSNVNAINRSNPLQVDQPQQRNAVIQRIRAGNQFRQLSTTSAVKYGMLLALNSGMVNGICLSGLLSFDGTKQASAAVTGAWTNSALGVATGNSDQFLFNTKCILSYFFGSFISGVINPNPKPFQVSVPSFRTAFLLGSILLYSSSVLSDHSNRTYIFLAAIANGIQNSLTSTTTGNLVRSSHFSGCTSDMGTFMGQVFRGNMENLMKLKVFFSLAMSFWVGGLISYNLVKNFGKQTLLFNAFLYLVLAVGVGYL